MAVPPSWLCLVIVILVATTPMCMAKGRRGNPTYPHDIKTRAKLTKLYNEPVISRQHFQRDMSSSDGGKRIPFIKHQGVKITTPSGEYLVHKGPNYGKKSDAVIVDAKHMSGAWKPKPNQPVKHGDGMTVGGVMKAANKRGSSYSTLGGNCIHSANDVMDH